MFRDLLSYAFYLHTIPLKQNFKMERDMTINRIWICCLICVSFQLLEIKANVEQTIRVLLIDGQNNHDWVETSQSLRGSLERTGLFHVVNLTSPGPYSDDDSWSSWRPDFQRFDVVVINYNGVLWPEPVRRAFVNYVRSGGGVAIIHAANNSFPEWKEYNQMIGLGWRDRNYGSARVFDDRGNLQSIPQGFGLGAGHGLKHSYLVRIREPEHPIMQGIPNQWLHATDELYHGQRGPGKNMTVLASAFSDLRQLGSGQHEPLVWVIPYGKGRVVTNVMGHHWPGEHSRNSLHCVGFQTIFNRTVQWLGTSKVTLPLPARFPSTIEAVLVNPVELGAPELPEGYRFLYQQRMGREVALSDFAFSDPGAWRYKKLQQGSGTLELFQKSKYNPPHRSPYNIVLINRHQFGSFVVDMKLQQTGREYAHRDLCLFFGFRDPAHFYYVHIASKTDDHAHNIFLVDGADRVKISATTTKGYEWGKDQWHRVRLQRDLASGSIQVFINDMSQPIMTANDKTLAEGWIGMGSFDDTGMVSDIRVWAPAYTKKNIEFFGGSIR